MVNPISKKVSMVTIILIWFFSCSSPRKLIQQSTSKSDTLKTSGTVIPAVISKPVSMTKTDIFLENLLEQYPQYFDELLKNRDSYHVQIIYTQINRGTNNEPGFTDYFFNVNPDNYYYPASTVKMPTALLALQRLHELQLPGLDKNSTMITASNYSGQNEVFNDPTTPDGRPSIGHYVKKIFLVSDNDAFNRLYEFLGQAYINNKMHAMGYDRTEIIHRLERFLSEDENRHTNPVTFYDTSGKLLYHQPIQINEQPHQDRKDWLGNAYYRSEKLVTGPMDFSKKNRFVLEDLHQVLRSILFPNDVPEKQRFRITPEEYQLVRKYMSQYPGESQYPSYKAPEYWDAYCKFLYWGSGKQDLPKTFRIFNKVGDAYGFLIDAAYVVDFEKKIEFMLSATIYCNSDGVLNDNKYDYDSVGYPFMKNLGRIIYDYELTRKRSRVPDLSSFQMSYEK